MDKYLMQDTRYKIQDKGVAALYLNFNLISRKDAKPQSK